jgi:TPR repeat protein
MYYHGQGVPQNNVEADLWYRKAADHGNAKAQYDLGNMYRKGLGVPQDYAETVSWYRKAADQGDAKAQYGLGFMYFHGLGVEQNQAEATRWYRKAADQGDAMAQRALGLKGTKSNAWRNVRYFFLAIAFLGSLVLLICPLLPGKNFRNWRMRTTKLLGVVGISYVGLSVYGMSHDNVARSVYALVLAKGLLIGTSIVIVVVSGREAIKRARGGWPMSGFSDMGTSTLHLRFEVYAYDDRRDLRNT